MNRFHAALAALAAVRVGIPLVALAGSGHDLPLLPRYEYAPLNGDSFGFYAAVRELLAAVGRVPPPLLALAALATAAAAVTAVRLWRGRRPWVAVALGTLVLALDAALVVWKTEPSGAAVIGWSLVWALPLAPLRAAGALDPDAAFVAGLVLSLAANAATVIATAYLGLHVSGSRAVGLGAAALFAVWPLLTGPLSGWSAWENGQWNVDVGLHLYTEPLSTALVTAGLAIVAKRAAGDTALAWAGAALGLATAVKLSNGLIAAVAAAALLAWRRRGALPLVAAGLAVAPVVLAHWPKGYATLFDDPNAYSPNAWELGYGLRNWTDSLLWTPATLAVLAPLAIVGALALPRRAAALLLAAIAVTAAFYSFYDVTRHHPRFLYAVVPALFVLEAAGVRRAVQAFQAFVRIRRIVARGG